MTVATLRNRLTDEDIRRLVRGSDPEERALTVRKICHRMEEVDLPADERAAAERILELILRDSAELVRRAMAVTLRQSKNLPHEIAMQLAADVESVATPVLLSSPMLDADDLVALVKASDSVKLCAIAARQDVPTAVVNELIETGDEKAVGIAASNDGADFDQKSYEKAFAAFCENRGVMDAFVARSHLPLDVTEKLIAHVSDEAMQRLVSQHALPPQVAVELSEATRERATIDLVEQAGLAHDAQHFVQQLRMNGRLTPSIILRSMLRGHVHFVEHAFAELAGVSHNRSWLLVHDAGPLGLRAIYDRTGMPPRLFPAFRAAIDIFHSMEVPTDSAGREHFQRVLAERAITRFQGIPEDDLNYILERMDEENQPPLRAAG
ncbi:MAG: DUF2336 domain-containing protein [Alphaproteobacteria bacterium]|nr:DUF2336 domain-containing protein [Alphaproteobacteria bacterium]